MIGIRNECTTQYPTIADVGVEIARKVYLIDHLTVPDHPEHFSGGGRRNLKSPARQEPPIQT